MDFKEFIRDYDILLNMPVTEELVCFQIAKILLDERIVVKKEGSNSKYCYKITDMLKRENLLSLDGFKLVGTLRSYTKFLNSFINELLKDDKYSFIDSSGDVPLVPINVVNSFLPFDEMRVTNATFACTLSPGIL